MAARTDESQPQNSLLSLLQIGTPLVLSVFGAYITWLNYQTQALTAKVSTQLQEIEQRYSRNKEISQRIFERIGLLSDANETKANMALISLIAIAEKPEEKKLLVRLALSSKKQSMQDTVFAFVSDESNKTILVDPINVEILRNIADKKDKVKQQNAPADQKYTELVRTEPNSASTEKLLEVATIDKSSGWLYVAKTLPGSNEKLDSNHLRTLRLSATTDLSALPKTYNLITTANLRAQAPADGFLGNITGLLGKGSQVQINKTTLVAIPETETYALWANVTVVKKSKDITN